MYKDGGEARIDNPVPASANHSQSDYSWVRAGFVLRSPLKHASTNATPACVTLICFGASTALEKRFERLALHPLWRETTSEPCNLFAIILDELFLQMDDLTWRLGNVFSSIEAVRNLFSAGAEARLTWIENTREYIFSGIVQPT
jgi:hypothetical protein